MKKMILLAMLCIVGSLSMQGGDYRYLVFTLNDGTTQAVTATDLSIALSDGNMVVTSGGQTLATLALSTLASMEFSNDDTTGISEISVNQMITDGSTVVYDLRGRRMPQGAALPKGVYIVKNSNRTFKVNIK
jgi:hypothetical protein